MPFCNFIQMTLPVTATPPFHCIAARTSTLNNWSLCTGMNCDWLIAKENSEQDKKWLCNKTFHWIFQFSSQKMHKRQSRTFTKWLKMVFGYMKENLSLWPSLHYTSSAHPPRYISYFWEVQSQSHVTWEASVVFDLSRSYTLKARGPSHLTDGTSHESRHPAVCKSELGLSLNLSWTN